MDGTVSLFSYLEGKYGQPLSLEEYLLAAYPQPEPLETKPEAEESLTFGCDSGTNIGILVALRNSASVLKEISSGIGDSDEPVVSKLIGNYIRNLDKLMKSEFISDGEKVAEKLVNILKKTLMKLWCLGQFTDVIRAYFCTNRIQMVEYGAGHKLSDDEFELLDDNLAGVLSMKAQDDSDKYKVIEMRQPVIKIYYIDEDSEQYYKVLPGNCKFYV